MSIRAASASDIPAILEIYAPYVEKTAYSFEYTVPTLAAFTERFHAITAQFPWLVYERDGVLLGYAYASAPFTRAAFRWCSEASVYLAPAARRQGIGRKLYAALEEILRFQGYQTVYALVTSANSASLAFHEVLGYRTVGQFPACGFKLGAWHGMIWMEKRLKAVETPMYAPHPWQELVQKHNFLSEILDKIPLS